MNAEEMYADIILDYYRNPRNFGTIKAPDGYFKDTNPVCGDIVEMKFRVEEGKIVDIRYWGKGCAISSAAAGMLTEMVMGKTIDEALKIKKEDVLLTLGIQISPMRLKCALLGYKVFKCALYRYIGKDYSEDNEKSA